MKHSALCKISSLLFALLLLAACGAPTESSDPNIQTGSSDAEIKSQVERAIAGASDLPAGLMVAVNQGAVTISGSLACEDCGGQQTPGNVGTVQQSLGAIVRAVPGVNDVQFSLSYAN
ncbi:MAG: BON domain-containing protein [Proteobacteria bacterium]|nr:BON domain-containing protein [Pseudomonadota bacterium]